MGEALPVDAVALRDEVRAKYRDVAVNPRGTFHFHTGRPLARRLGYDDAVVARMPESAIEAFAGVGNPFSLGALNPGERVVDLGSGGGFDCFVAAEQVGPNGRVVGVDITEEMLDRSVPRRPSWACAMSSSGKGSSKSCRSTTARPMSSSGTA